MADNDLDLICPACGKPLTKIFISSANCNIDVCLDGCGGIYFDNREFKKMDEQPEDIHELLEAIEGRTFEKVDSSKQRICPFCHTPMVKNFASAKREIEIDECYSCGGLFLDCGELQAIRNQFKTEQERIDHFNNKFAAEFSTINLVSDDAKENIDKKQKAGAFVRKLFGI